MPGPSQDRNEPPRSLRLAIFDDAKSAIDYYRDELFKGKADILAFARPSLPHKDVERLRTFDPDLIIVDLVMGRSRQDGLSLIRKLREQEILGPTPAVICSKLINASPRGELERERTEKLPGVKAAFTKYPAADDILHFARG